MSTRFNSYGTSQGLATESTQRQIKDRLNGYLDVNVVTLPGGGSNSNIVSVANSTLPDAHIPISLDRSNTTVAVNNIQLGGNNFSVNTGNSDIGTQRVVLASDQPALSSNVKFNGNNPSTDIGLADSNTQRVVLANNQTVDISLQTDFYHANNKGAATAQTQRVIISNDQDTANWSILPVKQFKYTSLGVYHQGFSTTLVSTDNFWRSITPISRRFHDSSTPGIVYSSDFFLPDVNSSVWILSDDAADASIGGSGAKSVAISYIDASNVLHTTTVALAGTAPVLVATDFFRLISASVVVTGSSLCNIGTISLLGASVPPLTFYPGCIAPKRNLYESSHIFLRQNVGTGYTDGRYTSNVVLDYINYLWNNSGGSDELIGIFVKKVGTTIWRRVNTQYNNSAIFYEPKISNILFYVGDSAYDIMISLLKTGAGTTSITCAIGWHYE